MNQNSTFIYTESPSGERLLRLLGSPSKKLIAEIAADDFDWLYLESGDWTNIDFLIDFKDKIKKLYIGSQNCDWSIISQLKDLTSLRVGGWFSTDLTFQNFSKLETLSSYWNEGYDDSLYELPDLVSLSLTGWKESDCVKLTSLPKLRCLSLIDCRSTTSVSGIDRIANIESVDLVGMRALQDCGAIGRAKSIKRLSIESCRKINSYDFLKDSRNLISLFILDSKDIDSLSVIADLPHLDRLVLGGTSIGDGDLAPLFKMPSLRLFAAKQKRHYNMKLVEIEQFLKEKWGEEYDWKLDCWQSQCDKT